MALSGLDIFKSLPKTNCGECGVPTCLAFAMKLAAGQAELTACPHVSEDAAAQLSEASAPPIRGVSVGTGSKAFKVGEETVLYRHEKTFVNPPAFGVLVDAGSSDDEIASVVKDADAMRFERVQQELRMGCVAIKSNGDAARFKAVAEKVAGMTELPLVLMSEDPAEMGSALEAVGSKKPLIHAATSANADAMAELAKQHGCPLAVRGEGPSALSDLAEKVAAAGVKDIVLDPAPATAADAFKSLTFIRRSALTKKLRTLGYPVITFPGNLAGGDPMLEALYAATDVAKYAGIIVLTGAEPWRMLPLLVLRQNIYTDPQRPMQVEQKVYEINNPGPDAPLMVTTNFSLTYFIVASEIEGSKMPARLAVVDSEGLSVLTGWAAGKFVPDRIAAMIKKSGVEEQVNHREIIIPGVVAQISGELEDTLDGWKVKVGPAEAIDIPSFLKHYAAA